MTAQPKGSNLTADGASQRAEHFSCILAVGDCQIETIMEIMDSAVLSDFEALWDKIEWHIHIGEEDFKALKHGGWDK